MITKEACCGGTCYMLVLKQDGIEHYISVNPVNDPKGKPRRIDCDSCYTCIRVFGEEVSDKHIFNAAFEHAKKHLIVPFEDKT